MDTDLFQGIKNPLRSVENSPVKIEEKIFKILHNLIIEFFKLSAKGSFPWQSHCKTRKAGCLSRKGFVTRKQESAVSMPKQSPAAQSELCATTKALCLAPNKTAVPVLRRNSVFHSQKRPVIPWFSRNSILSKYILWGLLIKARS